MLARAVNRYFEKQLRRAEKSAAALFLNALGKITAGIPFVRGAIQRRVLLEGRPCQSREPSLTIRLLNRSEAQVSSRASARALPRLTDLQDFDATLAWRDCRPYGPARDSVWCENESQMAPPNDCSGSDDSWSCHLSHLEARPSFSRSAVIRSNAPCHAGESRPSDLLASKGQKRRHHRSDGTIAAIGDFGCGQPQKLGDATEEGRGSQKHSLGARRSLLCL